MSSHEVLRRSRDDRPEGWYNAAAALLLGISLLLVFETHVADLEELPPELVFGFLGLYFYGAGYLSGRRTGKVGTGAWAGVACGLAFGLVVCVVMINTALQVGVHETIRNGGGDQVAIAWSGAVFYIMIGAFCGAAGARFAIQAGRQGR